MTSTRLAGRHALITGGARGLGYAIAIALAKEGASISLVDRRAESLAHSVALMQAADLDVHGAVLDVTDYDGVLRTVEVLDQRAPLDILINNAGIASEKSFLRMTPTEWQAVLDVNLTGMFYVAQACARLMAARGRGVIVNMASKNGLEGEVGYAHYNASKGGVIMLTKTIALELAHVGVRVNAVAPGYVQTPMSEGIDSPEVVHDFVARYIPLGRVGRVEDVSPLFVFLASDDSRFITGQVFIVDGGQLAGQTPSIATLERLASDS